MTHIHKCNLAADERRHLHRRYDEYMVSDVLLRVRVFVCGSASTSES